MAEIKWETVKAPQHVKFDNVGDRFAGRVKYYSPSTGETTFQGEPCGFLDLAPLGGGPVARITLDKPNLADRVRDAHPVPGLLIGVKYLEDAEGKNGRTFKRFEVFRGIETD